MDYFQYKPLKKYNDEVLKNRIHEDFELCGFSEEIQRGFLFFMGAALNFKFNDNIVAKNLQKENNYDNILKCLNLYSTSTGDFNHYGDLNDAVFSKWIYNANYILINYLSKSNINLDDQLKKVILPTGKEMVIGKTELDVDFLSLYKDKGFNLNNVHNLLDDFFTKIGINLVQASYDKESSYEAGYAYFNMQQQLDAKGAYSLINLILTSLTPLYEAFFYYPILQLHNSKILEANHLFSNIVQMINNELGESLGKSINSFHQWLFYEENTQNIRKEWDFNNGKEEELLTGVLINSIRIRETPIFKMQKEFQSYVGDHDKGLSNSIISRSKFVNTIEELMFEKYEMRLLGAGGWNNRGEFIQGLAFLFYEVCIYAVLPKQITG